MPDLGADDALAVLIARSNSGDVGALAELRAALPARGPSNELEKLLRDAVEAWADVASGSDPTRAARLFAGVHVTAAAIVRPGAGPLERHLATRLALAEARLVEIRASPLGASSGGPSQRVRRVEREVAAARRTLAALQQRLAPGP